MQVHALAVDTVAQDDLDDGSTGLYDKPAGFVLSEDRPVDPVPYQR